MPEDADPVVIAAAMNPAMSSWVALRRRITFQPGQSVLILGATGNAGQMAVQIACHSGQPVSSRPGAIRNTPGASPPNGPLRPCSPAAPTVAKPLDWIQVGSMAGPEITLPSFALRAANLRIMGSGQGSVTPAGIVAELPSLIDLLVAGSLSVDALPMPLAEVEQAWTAPTKPGRCVVLTTR